MPVAANTAASDHQATGPTDGAKPAPPAETQRRVAAAPLRGAA